ncbi:sulfatase [Anaerorudis cellulosivorans]|uniref:sulfatase n=1 Tax=Anaerorudis cellulosivorans TaxID=3397862 RepID=UPI002220CF82|nr:sulfatase [Seramator thermalis]MCW1735154.1 sulfatase [Seramator thermalis]
MNSKVIFSILSGASLPAFSSYSMPGEKQPNVLIILADDLGWNDLHCTGSNYYETPNIDGIARKGAIFTNAYAACQVSSPSRASILTGKTPARHGITTWIGETSGEEWRKMNRHTKMLPPDYNRQLSMDELTLPEKLKEANYTTFMAGKWHLGDEKSTPEMHGFDINIGGWESGRPVGGYFSPYNNPKLADGLAGEELSMRLAKETCNFIKNHTETEKNKPFFAYLSFYAVHSPIQTTKERWNYFRNKAERMGISEDGFIIDRNLPVRQHQDNPVYAGLIEQMDDAVGVVLQQLKDLGIEDNTVIIFTSDNGGVSSGDDYSTSNLPLRGGKGTQWEGGLRVPFIIQYSPKILGGISFNEPIIGMDIYPTILDYVGIKPVSKQHKDGISIRPIIENNQSKKIERELYWHFPHYGNQGGEPSSVIRKGDWKLIYYHEDERCELYNLQLDESENEFLNALYPQKVKELKNNLFRWMKKVNAKLPVADPLYDPRKETTYRKQQQEHTMKRQSEIRKEQLSADWRPNATWWGSIVD